MANCKWRGTILIRRPINDTYARKKAVHIPLLLVITGGIARQLENFSGEVFEDCSEVDGCTSTDTLSVVAALEHTVDTTDGELKTGF